MMKKLSLSRRSERIWKAEIRTMTVECERVGGINLAQGVCDMEVPRPVIDGADFAMNNGHNAYTRHDGIEELRRAISKKMWDFNGIRADPETEIVVSCGSTGSLYSTCMALLDPGDEVILFEPYYGYHVNTLLAVDVVPVFVEMSPPDWSFSIKALRSAVSPRTKAIIVNTPNNPTGKVYSGAELNEIAEVALEFDLFVITDEIYEYFIYDGGKHLSPGVLKEISDRTITISGVSKTYSITGWRIGYSVCRAEWAEMIGYVNDLIYVCAPAPLQFGVADGINSLGPEYYDHLLSEFDAKRRLICSTLEKTGFRFSVPQGAYYVLADASRLPGSDSKARAMFLLEKTGVARY